MVAVKRDGGCRDGRGEGVEMAKRRECPDEDVAAIVEPDWYRAALLIMLSEILPAALTDAHRGELVDDIPAALGGDDDVFTVMRAVVLQTWPTVWNKMAFGEVEALAADGYDVERLDTELHRLVAEIGPERLAALPDQVAIH